MTTHASLVPLASVVPGSYGQAAIVSSGPNRRDNGPSLVKPSGKLARLFVDLVEGFDERELAILFYRSFPAVSASKLQELGDDFGTCRERVRQIESQCIKILKRRLSAARYRPLLEVSSEISAAVGMAVPLHWAEAAGFVTPQSRFGRGKVKSPESFMRTFLFGWGTSYELRDEWIIRKPVARHISKTQSITRSLLKKGAVPAEQVTSRVVALGIRQDVVRQWISRFGQARFIGSSAIRWKGTLADKAVALLGYAKEPMTNQGISELLGPSHSIESLNNYLSVDHRFERIRRGLYRLRGSD